MDVCNWLLLHIAQLTGRRSYVDLIELMYLEHI